LADLIPCIAFAARRLGSCALHSVEIPLKLRCRAQNFEGIGVTPVDQTIPRLPGGEVSAHGIVCLPGRHGWGHGVLTRFPNDVRREPALSGITVRTDSQRSSTATDACLRVVQTRANSSDVAGSVVIGHGLGAGSPTYPRIGRLLTCTLSGRCVLEPASSACAEAEITLPLNGHEDLDRVRTSDEPRDHPGPRRGKETSADQQVRVGAEGLEPPTSAL
jgi:hypothetical protein